MIGRLIVKLVGRLNPFLIGQSFGRVIVQLNWSATWSINSLLCNSSDDCLDWVQLIGRPICQLIDRLKLLTILQIIVKYLQNNRPINLS